MNGNVLVPRADERTPLATDPAVRAIVARYLAAYPRQLPNRTDINERALNTNAPQAIDGDNAQVRLDQALAGRDRLSLLYGFTAQRVDAFQLIAGQNPDTDTKSHTTRATWSRTWSAETVTDVSVGFDRVRSLLVPEPNAVGPLVLTGFVVDFLGPDDALPIDRADNRWRAAGAVHQVRGRHYLHLGGEVLRRQVNGSESQAHRGIVFFSSDFGRDALTNMRLGTPSRYQVTRGHIHRGFRNWDLQFYAGDSWRATTRLTLDYNLRYQPVTAPVEVNRLTEIPYDCDCNNLAPRFGFALRLGGRWGVLRGAYGLEYGEVLPVTYLQARFNPPQNLAIVIPTPYLADPLRGLRPEDLAPTARSNRRSISPELATPYSHQYNFSWEPEPGGRVKLQLGYVGSRSPNLPMLWYTNRAQPVAGIPLSSETINQRRADPRHFDVYRVLNASRGYYDAGKATVIVPRWRGVSVDASYWFSKAIDLGAAYTNTAYDKDGRLGRSQSEQPVLEDMKGLSGFDQTHSFLTRVSWSAPRRLGGWDLSAVWLQKTGTPFDVASGSDGPGIGNVDGQNGDRVDIVDPSILGRTIGDPRNSRERLPRAAFAFMRPGESRGSIGHHVFRKGGIANLNASLARAWKLGGERALTLRAESINFFNTPQFAEPGKELSSPSFGFITNTLNDGRTFRFLLRFAF